jgi:uncharacterized membrane protein YecN with MAPEG domain
LIALACIGFLGLLVFGLGLAISLTRRRLGIGTGYPDDPSHPLYKLVRAHTNTIEYAPTLGLLIYIVDTFHSGPWVSAMTIGATVSRYLMVAGMLLSGTHAKAHPLRFLGALGTYVFGLVLCVLLLASL